MPLARNLLAIFGVRSLDQTEAIPYYAALID